MRLRFEPVVAAALLLSPGLALAAEATFDRTLNVSGTTYLYVDTGAGYIHVSPGSDNQVHIYGRVKAGNSWGWGSNDGGSPDERVKKVAANPPIQQQGSTIRIGKGSDPVRNVSIDYEITAPGNTQVEASSGSGDVRINRITGGVQADTGSGSIEANSIGGYVSLETGSGDIHADIASGRDVKAHTGSGNIHLANVQGSLKADTGSGNIEVTGQPSSPWKAETGSGNITLSTGSAHFNLDAQTGSGNVHTDAPLTTTSHGSEDKHHISGEINGGGPMIRLETGSGNITIH